MSFFDSILSAIATFVDFLVSIVENTFAFLKLIPEVVRIPTILSGHVFQPLAVCIVTVIAVAVIKNILGRV